MQFRERYQFEPSKDLVGTGGFAKVYKAFDTIRKRTVALKFYNGVSSDKYDIISEINRMEDIVHPNLIRYYDATVIQSTNAIGEIEKLQVGIMEFANAGDVGGFFKERRSMKVTRDVIEGILMGLQFMHMQDIAHRDLKPKNILLNKKASGEVMAKIADFGISKRVTGDDADVSSQLLGSVEHMAPEQFAPAVYGINGKLDTNVDLWSLGVIIYEIFAGKLPFGSRTQGITYEQILNNILFQNLEVDYSLLPKPYDAIVKRCLVKKAGQRVRQAEELLDILRGNNAATKVTANNTQAAGSNSSAGSTSNSNPSNSSSGNSRVNTEIIPPNRTPKATNTPNPTNTGNSTTVQPKSNTNNRPPNKVYVDDTPKSTPTPPQNQEYIHVDKGILQALNQGKELFKDGDYNRSFQVLSRLESHPAFDTESRFYLGYMYYNGKCGGAHDVVKGRKMMNDAKRENRALVLDLMVKYVLNN